MSVSDSAMLNLIFSQVYPGTTHLISVGFNLALAVRRFDIYLEPLINILLIENLCDFDDVYIECPQGNPA